MKVLGVDASKKATGVAVYTGDPKDALAWTLRPPSERKKDILRDGAQLWKSARYCAEWLGWYETQWVAILGEHRPDWVFIEAPRPPVQQRERKKLVDTGSQWAGQSWTMEKVGGTQFQSTFDLCAGLGALLGRLGVLGYAEHTVLVPVSEWRKSIGIPANAKSADAKRQAKDWCRRLGMQAASADAAEASLIARYGFEIKSNRVDQRDDLFKRAS